MTITTSKQLAEALGTKWRASKDADSVGLRVATFRGVQVLCGEPIKGVRATDGGTIVYRKSPRAAVLALADRLEAEARALRESVPPRPTSEWVDEGGAGIHFTTKVGYGGSITRTETNQWWWRVWNKEGDYAAQGRNPNLESAQRAALRAAEKALRESVRKEGP